uniref:Putative conserved secreted protein n=1 Tax=Nyssomyia neivai TaxID=330878 RepID=A0A1L8DP95_9DIPT
MEIKITLLCLAVVLLMMVSDCKAGVGGQCPLSSKMTMCSPKCKDDTECSTLGGKCCPNICNTKSCLLPGSAAAQSASAAGYKGSSSGGTGTYCGNVKCNSGEKCDFDKSSKRQKCVRG